MSPVKLYVPCDSAALAVGADEVADALRTGCSARGHGVEIVRNGSRGLFWLEPLVEVANPRRPRGLRPGGARGRARACWTPACCRAASTRCARA